MAYPSAAIEAQGTIINIRNQAASAWLAIGESAQFDGPNGSASVIDVSHLTSLRREKRMGLADEGQLSISGNREPDDLGQIEFRRARGTREKKSFQILYSDGSKDEFDGFCLSFSTSGAVDQVVQFSATVEITGAVTFTPAP
jgi:hypothetical protein